MAPSTLPAPPDLEENVLLQIDDLAVEFKTEAGILRAISKADFTLQRGEALGVVGESGCGKSVLSETILRLIPSPPGRLSRGRILYRTKTGAVVDLAAIEPKGKVMRSIRGNDISMIFQEPMTSLNPIFSIGNQIAEVIRLHQKVDKKEARRRAIALLEEVHIPDPGKRVDEYPHQISGGMRQRVMIAMALACEPSLLIADEPTTALDVTVQAQILKLIREMQQKRGMSVIFISHDLGVISEVCDRVAVMYMGHVVEKAPIDKIFSEPSHPYTRGLLGCLPDLVTRRTRLYSIPGHVPIPIGGPRGCPFYSRCEFAMKRCEDEMPPEREIAPSHFAACWLNEGEDAR